MKPQALRQFRRKLHAGEALYGLCITLESAAVSDIAAGLGLDWIMIEAENGHLDWAEILEHVRATVRSDTVALVRLGNVSPELIKRLLDIGADGLAVSGIKTPAQLQAVVNWARPSPSKGLESDVDALVVPIIDPWRTEDSFLELLGIDGIEVFLFDFEKYPSKSGSHPRGLNLTRPELDRKILEIRKHEKHAGMIVPDIQSLPMYRDIGFGMLGLGFDETLILNGIRSMLAVAGANVQGKDGENES
jgi:2-dehydro-3-deoxyglucarate aldolase/4-hydroxy-2-oxoheptanedioate aldolase